MLTTKKITSQSSDLKIIKYLYEKAFPSNERSPFELLLDDETNCSEIYAFYDKDIFCGFVSLLTLKDISHIIYFAVNDDLRGKGYGSLILQLLNNIKSNYRIIADIELSNNSSSNNIQREKRKNFYIKNGYYSSGIEYNWRDEYYEILINYGTLTKEEFWEFWDNVSKINYDFSKF